MLEYPLPPFLTVTAVKTPSLNVPSTSAGVPVAIIGAVILNSGILPSVSHPEPPPFVSTETLETLPFVIVAVQLG